MIGQALSVVFVSKIKSILSIIFHAINGAVCIQITHFSYDECENMCTLSFYHYEVENMSHLQLLGHEIIVNGMRCMSFYILIA